MGDRGPNFLRAWVTRPCQVLRLPRFSWFSSAINRKKRNPHFGTRSESHKTDEKSVPVRPRDFLLATRPETGRLQRPQVHEAFPQPLGEAAEPGRTLRDVQGHGLAVGEAVFWLMSCSCCWFSSSLAGAWNPASGSFARLVMIRPMPAHSKAS